MSVFVARSKFDPLVYEFLEETRERGSQALVEINAKVINRGGLIYWVNVTRIKIPPIYYLGFIFLALFLWRVSWIWGILTFLFLSIYIVFSKAFHVWAFKKGLRKKGYTGKIEILDLESGLREVLLL
jgi:hypothetical protein